MAQLIVARTARQILRELTPDDAESMFELNGDPEVMRYVGEAAFASVAAARSFLEDYKPYRTEGMGRWASIDAGNGEFLGWCGLRLQSDGDVDLGYRYKRAHWGRGLATEAGWACLELAFGPMNLKSVVAKAHVDNGASVRVMVKLGFSLEGPTTMAGLPAVLYRLRREDRP